MILSLCAEYIAEPISVSEHALGLILTEFREASLLFSFSCNLSVCSPFPSFADCELQWGSSFASQACWHQVPPLSQMARNHQPCCLGAGQQHLSALALTSSSKSSPMAALLRMDRCQGLQETLG